MHICSNKGFKIKQTYNMEEYHLVIYVNILERIFEGSIFCERQSKYEDWML